MKTIFISQRVDVISEYNEKRDALDQKWTELMLAAGCVLVPVQNDIKMLKNLHVLHNPDGIILSGGNSPVQYGGDAPERDITDTYLLNYATENGIPLLGVCRGMQSIILHFGGTLKKVDDHIAIRHNINGELNLDVNSFHSLAADSVPECIEVTAKSDDDIVEAVRHKDLPIIGIMWHPEREQPYIGKDLELIKKLFGS